jgi:hypothetical protein
MSVSTDANQKERKLGTFPFVLGGMSFIPLLGILFGIAALTWGLVTKRAGGKKLALIGAGGIGFTFVLYGGLFYFGFVQRGGVYDHLRDQMAQSMLNSLVPAIEYYKVEHGSYPESLEELRKSLPKNSFIFVADPRNVGFGRTPENYYYKRVGDNHYYLRGVGQSGKPFGPDDIVPQVDRASLSKLGLLIEPPNQ